MTIEIPALELELLPEAGGKIGQIRDRSTGRAFLIPPQRPCRTLPPGGTWMDGDTSGMDDCFPNIAEGEYPAEPWKGTPLPQLGEWVYGCWEVVEQNGSAVTLERDGIRLPYRARKTVALADERALDLRYAVENRSDSPMRYMWAAHPLIAAGDEFNLSLPAGEKSIWKFPPDGRQRRWPSFDGVNLEHEWIRRGRTLKVFVTGLRQGWCELAISGYTLRFEFDVQTTPVLGIWYNNFGFPPDTDKPFRCIAVEPCTSPSDLLDALPPDAYRIVPPRGEAAWGLRLTIG